MMTARILHLQRLSTEDGPGIRTTVFFKGCSLRCEWCHNPESISPQPQIQWLETHCIACDTCLDVCPEGCLSRLDGALVIDRDRCSACGDCVEACPAGAMELLGSEIEISALVREVLKDRNFYSAATACDGSAGGVTASGGEPALQPAFVAELFRRLRDAGVSTALDTCGMVSAAAFEQILPHTDLVLFDLKELDPVKHRRFTGHDNRVILERLRQVRDCIRSQASPLRLWVRTPLIPGATAAPENLADIGAFLARELDGLVERWEVCAFNNLCRDKYRRLGINWRYQDTSLLSPAELESMASIARQSGFPPERIFATGATRQM